MLLWAHPSPPSRPPSGRRLREEVQLATRDANGKRLAAHLRRSALDADLHKLGHLLGAKLLSDEDCRVVALNALKVELARKAEPRYSSDVLELAPASLALALSSSPKQEDLETEQLDKHEKALLSQVVKPQDVAVAFDSIGGLNDAKKALREAITYPLKYPSLYQDGVAREACKGVLLFGPPGTGKTMLAKAVATEGGAAFLAIDASSIENKWLGESEKNAKAVFSLARRLAPCVVYIDEVDAVLSSREGGDDTSHGTLTSVKTTLMQEWDGLRTTQDRVVVIGSTNRPYDLEEAAAAHTRRPARSPNERRNTKGDFTGQCHRRRRGPLDACEEARGLLGFGLQGDLQGSHRKDKSRARAQIGRAVGVRRVGWRLCRCFGPATL